MSLFWTQRKMFWLQTFFIISSIVFRTNTLIQVWIYFWVNDDRVFVFRCTVSLNNQYDIKIHCDFSHWESETGQSCQVHSKHFKSAILHTSRDNMPLQSDQCVCEYSIEMHANGLSCASDERVIPLYLWTQEVEEKTLTSTLTRKPKTPQFRAAGLTNPLTTVKLSINHTRYHFTLLRDCGLIPSWPLFNALD